MTTVTNTCDACGIEIKKSTTPVRVEVSLSVYDSNSRRAALSLRDFPKSSIHVDLCESCGAKAEAQLKALLKP
jgi:hypothetical protein